MKDYRSLEHKIRLIREGRLTPDGWELVAENTWFHPIADITRTIDADGNERIVNKLGQDVSVGIPQAKTLHQKLQIKSKIIDEAFPQKKDDKKDDKDKKPPFGKGKDKEEKDPANDKGLEGKDKKDGKKTETPSKNTDLETSDRKDPKEIKGGKTEVDTEPTTNDKTDDDSDAKKKKKQDIKEMSTDKLKDYVNKTGVHRDPKYPKLALKKIADKKAAEKQVKEEAIDEINHDTLKSYIHKASSDPQRRQGVHMAAYKRMKNIVKDSPATTKRGKEQQDRMLKNQHARATSAPMKKPGTTHANEMFSADELAHIEAVMSEEYVDMSKKTVDSIINAKGKPHKVYTATDETRHGISVDELKRHLGVSDSPHVNKKFMHNLHTAGIRTGWSHSAGKWICYHGPKV